MLKKLRIKFIALNMATVAVVLTVIFAAMFLNEEVRAFRLTAVFIGLAAVFLAMSPMLMLSGEWLTMAWCLQALAMLWLAHQTGNAFLGQAAGQG